MCAKSVKTKNVPESPGKNPTSQTHAFKDQNPCWQINQFDLESKWGEKAALGNVSFSVSTELFELLCKYDENDLSNALDKLKSAENIGAFFKKVKTLFDGKIPSEIVHKMIEDISFSFFKEKIYPKLRDFEKSTWQEIDNDQTGKDGRSKHHYIAIENLSKEAQSRLSELKLDDIDSLYSLRLEGKLRIFGIRKMNYFKILWVDPDHEICPSQKKHT